MKRIFFAIFVLFAVCSCTDFSTGAKIKNALTLGDSKPPVLLEVSSESDKTVRLVFNEKVRPFSDSFDFCNAIEDGNTLLITLPSSLLPGVSAEIAGRVSDSVGNTAQVKVLVWGYNPKLPKAMINEVTTKGSENSPDRTEILFLEDGNTAGMTIYAGTPEDNDGSFTFPSVNVCKGDFATVIWTGNGKDTELNFHAVSSGLTSNNGTIVLTSSPAQGADILDAFLYSSFESSQFEGWGTKTAFQRAKWVIFNGSWTGDAVNSTSSTATRSMSRIASKEDSNTCADWYTTVTGGATFGSANISAPY